MKCWCIRTCDIIIIDGRFVLTTERVGELESVKGRLVPISVSLSYLIVRTTERMEELECVKGRLVLRYQSVTSLC